MNKIKITDGRGFVRTLGMDPRSNIVYQTDPGGNVSSSAWLEVNTASQYIDTQSGGTSFRGYRLSFTFDSKGNLQRMTNVLVITRAILTSKLRTDNAFSARFYKAVATLLADRLRKTVSHLGYHEQREGADPDELDEPLMDSASMGATRFDRLLKRLRIN